MAAVFGYSGPQRYILDAILSYSSLDYSYIGVLLDHASDMWTLNKSHITLAPMEKLITHIERIDKLSLLKIS